MRSSGEVPSDLSSKDETFAGALHSPDGLTLLTD